MRKITLIAFFATLGILISALIYTSTFQTQFENQELHGIGVARILIPDTYLYKNESERIIIEDNSIGINSFPVKNSIGPIFLWAIAESDWHLISIINAVFIFLSLIYFLELCKHFNIKISAIKAIILFILAAPIIMYYSIGALKELPTLLGFLGFFYYYIKNKYTKSAIFIVLLILFRYQLMFVVITFIMIDYLTKNPLKIALIILIMVASIYPFIFKFDILTHETTALFRSNQDIGLGASVELMRDNIPILSVAAILIRDFQTIFEPILTVIASGTLFESDGISLYLLFNFMQDLIIAPCWIIIFYKLIFFSNRKDRDTNRMLSLIFLFLVPVGGFSFISYRYLFPITGLIILCTLKLNIKKNILNK